MDRRSFAGLGSALLLPGALRAQQPPPAESIVWQVRHMPPHFVYREPQQPPREPAELSGQGSVDSYMRLLLPLLPQYRHEFIETTPARAEALVREGRSLCSLLLLRTAERLHERYFTPAYPVLGALQVQLVVHRDQLARFAALGPAPLSLAALLQRPELSGMYSAGRSFGSEVDRVIRAQPETRRPLQGVVVVRHSSVLTMLRARRMDYALEYPAPVEDYLRTVNAPGELVCLPIAEAPLLTMMYVSCTRSEAGRRRIEAIDAAIRELGRPALRAPLHEGMRHGRPYGPAERARVDRFFDERARGGALIE